MTTLYQIESTWVNLAIYTENSLYLILKNNIYQYFGINFTQFEYFLSHYSRGKYLNKHKSTVFSNYEYIYYLNTEKLGKLLDFLPKYGLISARKQYKSTIEFIEDCCRVEFNDYLYIERGEL